MNARDGMRRLREARRAAGLCTRCGLERPAEGQKRCAACQQAARERYRKNKGRWPQKNNAAASLASYYKRRNARIAAGVCIRCGVNRPEVNKKTCNACLRWMDQKRKVNRDENVQHHGSERA